MRYKLTNEKIEVGDIVAYISYKSKRIKGKRPIRVEHYALGIWEEYLDVDSKKFRNKVSCIDDESTIVWNEKWLKKVEVIK